MGIQQVRKAVALLCHGGEGHHAINETHHHPVDRVLRRRRAGVPPEERQARNSDEEPEADEVKAEFGFIDAPVTSSGECCGAVGKKAHDGEGHEGPDRREGAQVAELGRSVGNWWGREDLGHDDG